MSVIQDNRRSVHNGERCDQCQSTGTVMTIKYEYNNELDRDIFWEMLILKTKENQGNL